MTGIRLPHNKCRGKKNTHPHVQSREDRFTNVQTQPLGKWQIFHQICFEFVFNLCLCHIERLLQAN